MRRIACLAALAAVLLAPPVRASAADDAARAAPAPEPPIRVVFDLHMDPLPPVPLGVRKRIYLRWCENANWLLDIVGPLGVKVSFLMVGEFAEFCVDDGPDGPGCQVLRRLHRSGGVIGSHSHTEYQRGPHDWPSARPGDSGSSAKATWSDNVRWVNQAISTALGITDPAQVASINTLRGSHLPADMRQYHAYMKEFGFTMREGGPEEDFYKYFQHYIWQPFRPAAANPLDEDLATPFVAIPAGPVLGLSAVHKGIAQDFDLPSAQAMFLQCYLNWRFRERTGAEDRVWVFGWAVHGSDIDPDSVPRAAVAGMTRWLGENFIGRRSAAGHEIAVYAAHAEVRDAYLAWEKEHPGASSFRYPARHGEWSSYPYLPGVNERLHETEYVGRLDLGGGVVAHRLTGKDGPVVVAWRDSGATTVDLGSVFAGKVEAVGAEGERLVGTDHAAVPVGPEAVIVR